jgi:hypothetical protein
MSRFSICSYYQPGTNGVDQQVLSVFIYPYEFSDEMLDNAIAPYLSKGGPFNTVHFVGYPESIDNIKTLFRERYESSAAFKRISRVIRDFEANLRLISINPKDGNPVCQMLDGKDVIDTCLLNRERHQSLQALFIRNNGLVNAHNGTHYAKQSQTHSTQFLRSANVLESSGNAFQIAFWVIQVIGMRTISRIVVDTSGIDSVAFVIGYEIVKMGLQSLMPVIESHHSHGGLEFLSVPNGETTLFLISATTSGGLHPKLVGCGAKPENIITLYYLANNVDAKSNILCNLTLHSKENRDGLEPIKNYPSDDCPYCNSHSYAIAMEGDQFTTEPARIAELDIALSDFSIEHRSILSDLSNTGLFKVFRSANERSFEIYLDVEAMFKNIENDFVNKLRIKVRRFVKRGIPTHLKRIIYTKYPGAEFMSREVFAFATSTLNPENITVIGSEGLGNQGKQAETASLVMSACMDDTYELMGISRDLRVIQPGGNTTYIAPLFRTSSKLERTRIESNLTFGEEGSKTFSLYSAIGIELPACESLHSWKLEFEKLNNLVHWAELENIALPPEIDQRIALLRSAPAIGMSEKLFWPSPSGDELSLGSDFTMAPTDNGQKYTQADIFVIASSLFHQYRQGVSKKPRLICKSYERTVISPENFQRFSDAILQSAFLRAARGGEIGYANCEEEVSKRMLRFLSAEVEAAKHGRGQTLMEYVISIMIGRLTLYPNHRKEFLSAVESEYLIPDWIKVCARFIIQKDGIN